MFSWNKFWLIGINNLNNPPYCLGTCSNLSLIINLNPPYCLGTWSSLYNYNHQPQPTILYRLSSWVLNQKYWVGNFCNFSAIELTSYYFYVHTLCYCKQFQSRSTIQKIIHRGQNNCLRRSCQPESDCPRFLLGVE